MAEITAALVKDLREKSGVGMMDCKKALQENNGDIDAAIDWLRAKGLSKAAKKADRAAAEGLVAGKLERRRQDRRADRAERRDRLRRQERHASRTRRAISRPWPWTVDGVDAIWSRPRPPRAKSSATWSPT